MNVFSGRYVVKRGRKWKLNIKIEFSAKNYTRYLFCIGVLLHGRLSGHSVVRRGRNLF